MAIAKSLETSLKNQKKSSSSSSKQDGNKEEENKRPKLSLIKTEKEGSYSIHPSAPFKNLYNDWVDLNNWWADKTAGLSNRGEIKETENNIKNAAENIYEYKDQRNVIEDKIEHKKLTLQQNLERNQYLQQKQKIEAAQNYKEYWK